MRSKQCTALIFAAVAVLMQGCNTIPLRNEPLEQFTEGGGYRYNNIAPAPNNSDSLKVFVTFSGGGTRAAAFSYGVLEKLRDTEIVWEGQRRRLLDEIDVISSVSGGSLPAAYYALFGDKIFEQFPDKVLYADIQGNIVSDFFSPFKWPKLLSPFYGRTDMMADDFTKNIFEGKTFNDLLDRNQRPFIVLNSTDISLGSRFDFTQRQFDLLYSDLSAYPVGHAVAASAAFPGLLTPVTLRNYPKGENYVAPAWIGEELMGDEIHRLRHRQALEAESYIETGRPYIYLSDGGISDNLGVLPVLQLLGGVFPGDGAETALSPETTKKVVVITVNAKVASQAEQEETGKGLGLFNILGVASSTPMSNFSDAQMVLLDKIVRQKDEARQMRDRITAAFGEAAVAEHFPEFAVPDIDYHLVEVEFGGIADEEERDYLNMVPTAFKLERDQVDRLRKAAVTILDSNTNYLTLVNDLK
jgi:predicted acylesterase/phospholipase RssA